MPNILAAMGVAQLENINNFIKKKRDNAVYNQLLKGIKVLHPVEKVGEKRLALFGTCERLPAKQKPID